MSPNPKRVLLLGASGKLGQMVQALWSAYSPSEFELIPVYREARPEGPTWHSGMRFDHLPQVNAIIALWGVTSGDAERLAQNTTLAIAAQNMAQTIGAKVVLHCSSASVYAPGRQLNENAACAPVTAYGLSKLDMEQAISDWHRAHPNAVNSCALRIANLAGADSLFTAMRDREHILLDRFENGHGPKRSYLSPVLFVQVLTGLLQCVDLPKVLNIASDPPVFMDELAVSAGREITWQPAPPTAISEVSLNIERLAAVLPDLSLRETPEDIIRNTRATEAWA